MVVLHISGFTSKKVSFDLRLFFTTSRHLIIFSNKREPSRIPFLETLAHGIGGKTYDLTWKGEAFLSLCVSLFQKSSGLIYIMPMK